MTAVVERYSRVPSWLFCATPTYTTASCLGSDRMAEARYIHTFIPHKEKIAVVTADRGHKSASSRTDNGSNA